jgi:hypothetical protein
MRTDAGSSAFREFGEHEGRWPLMSCATHMKIDAASSAFPDFGEHEGLWPLVS